MEHEDGTGDPGMGHKVTLEWDRNHWDGTEGARRGREIGHEAPG